MESFKLIWDGMMMIPGGLCSDGRTKQRVISRFSDGIETVNLALFDLAELGLANGQCLSEAGAENGVEPGGEIIDKFLDVIPHDFKKMTTGPAAVSYTGRVYADGPTIKVWYGLTEDFPDDPLQEPTKIPVMLEINNSAHVQGGVGIWQESNDNGIIDNIYVFDEKGLAVAPKGKLATTWGLLKKTPKEFPFLQIWG